MVKTAIVSTSINATPGAYAAWAKQGTLIVAGDTNSPPELREYVEQLGGIYLPTDFVFPGSEFVPFKCVQRRNAAIWYAVTHDYDAVLTVDDDNLPAQDYFVSALTGELGHRPRSLLASNSLYLNLGDLCIPPFRQRGCPYGARGQKPRITTTVAPPEVVVAQAMVIGDPDCDAVERMVNKPNVTAVIARGVVQPGIFAAFNSQATAWRQDWAPAMAVLPHVGRYDDIFASFIFARLARTYNVALYAGDPVVVQERNEHNLVKDLAAEHFGMSVVFEFCEALSAAHISDRMPVWQAYGELIVAVQHILPLNTVHFATKWANAWRDLK